MAAESETIWRLLGVVMAGWGAYNILHPGPGARRSVAWNRWLGKRAPWTYLRSRKGLERDQRFKAVTNQKTWEVLTRCLGGVFVVVGVGFASGWLLPASTL